MSAESGVPTYRGKGGIWAKYNWEEVACEEAFRRDPEKVLEFHALRRQELADCRPHRGHAVIASLEERHAHVSVVPQNLDGLHQRAGSGRVIELHGDALSYECMDCAEPQSDVPFPAPSYPPLCSACGAAIRPRVVLFGEMLPPLELAEAEHLSATADVFLAIGTSVLVQPAASLPFVALQSGAMVVEINPRATALTGSAQHTVHGGAAMVVPRLWEAVRARL